MLTQIVLSLVILVVLALYYRYISPEARKIVPDDLIMAIINIVVGIVAIAGILRVWALI